MIRKRACEAVRKTGEQEVYEDDERGQGKTLGKTAGDTCQTQQVCTQVTGMDSFIPRNHFLPSPRAFSE